MATDKQKETRPERESVHQGKEQNRSLLNRIWLWLGVIILVAILLYWLFAIGTFEGPNQ